MKYILIAFLVYVAYQLLFGLIIPIFKASRKIKKGFREMQNRMQEQQSQEQMKQQQPEIKHSDDYIDYEEVK